jgi:RNase adaptor protein for sRNA GlmZ degradation
LDDDNVAARSVEALLVDQAARLDVVRAAAEAVRDVDLDSPDGRLLDLVRVVAGGLYTAAEAEEAFAQLEAELEAAEAELPVTTVVSFGFMHGPAPEAALVLDLRELLRDPHLDEQLRQLTGLHPRVLAHVMATPGAETVLSDLEAAALTLISLGRRAGAPVTLAVGCTGGHHRSVAMACQLSDRLEAAGWPTRVVHRDVDTPVGERS